MKERFGHCIPINYIYPLIQSTFLLHHCIMYFNMKIPSFNVYIHWHVYGHETSPYLSTVFPLFFCLFYSAVASAPCTSYLIPHTSVGLLLEPWRSQAPNKLHHLHRMNPTTAMLVRIFFSKFSKFRSHPTPPLRVSRYFSVVQY